MLVKVGPIQIEVPRDRAATFGPVIVTKRQEVCHRRWAGRGQLASRLFMVEDGICETGLLRETRRPYPWS